MLLGVGIDTVIYIFHSATVRRANTQENYLSFSTIFFFPYHTVSFIFPDRLSFTEKKKKKMTRKKSVED